MKSKSSSRPPEQSKTVNELLKERATLEGWLARVDDCSTEVEERVAERVRADYEARLEATLEQLRTHTESLSRDLENARTRLTQAEKDAAAAAETLQEGGLRYRIGEISEEEWEKRRVPLDKAVKEADDERLAARLEVTRLTEIVEDVGHAPTPSEVSQPELAWLTDSDEVTQVQEAIEAEEPAAAAEPAFVAEPPAAAEPEDVEEEGDELAFLEQLDRVFDDSTPEEDTPDEQDEQSASEETTQESDIVLETPEGELVTDDDIPTENTEPVPGIKCPSCGYTNEATAWYCEVCGVDLD